MLKKLSREREREEEKKIGLQALGLKKERYKTNCNNTVQREAEISKKIKAQKTVTEAKPALKYNKTSKPA